MDATLNISNDQTSFVITDAEQRFTPLSDPTGILVVRQRPGGKAVFAAKQMTRTFAPGDRIDIRLGDRRCLGYLDKFGLRIPCPDGALACVGKEDEVGDESGRRKRITGYCSVCASRTHVPPALAKSFPTRPKLALKRTPHVLYLATFDGRTVKVGTVQADRLHRRLGEQGARFAFVLLRVACEADALAAEAKVGGIKRFDREKGKFVRLIPESVAPSAKLAALSSNTDVSYMRDELARIVGREIRRRRPELGVAPADELEGVVISQSFLGELPASVRSLKKSGVELRGEVLGTLGGFLIFEEEGERFAVTLRSLHGQHYTNIESQRREARQLSLFAH
jgi:Protein of unknown function (DUF2797)